MSEATVGGVTQRGLVQQGYCDLSPQQLNQLVWGLRFTPAACMLGCLVGLSLQLPWVHFALAALGILPFFTPAHHPVDLLYNYGLRHLFGAPALPPNPLPRRVACALGGGMNLAIGLLFQAGQPLVAYGVGGMLIALQLIVISSHFCVASWMIEVAGRLLGLGGGRAPAFIGAQEARDIVAAGGVLVDVRSPLEFAQEHLPDAINVPVDELPVHLDELRAMHKPLVLYCASGRRCGKAAQALREAGLESVHELGTLQRWTG